MNQQKRIAVFFLVAFCWMIAASRIAEMMGWNPRPKKPPAQLAAGKDKAAQPKPDVAEAEAGSAPKNDVRPGLEKKADQALVAANNAPHKPSGQPEIKLWKPTDLVLGSATDKSPDGFRLEVHLDQKGAGIESLNSSRFHAEFELGKERGRPLEFIRRSALSPPSLSLTLSQVDGKPQGGAQPEADQADENDEQAALRKAALDAEDLLDSVVWEVVPHDGKPVRTVERIDPVSKSRVAGQAIEFRTSAASGVVVTKIFRLFPNMDALEVELQFQSGSREQKLVYNLLGPHGIPIEGIWYTGTFRELFFGHLNQGGATDVVTHLASEVVSASPEKPIDNTTWPLRFAGVENQHFATFVEPVPPPTGQEDRWDAKATAVVLEKSEKLTQQPDVAVRITSKPITVAPDHPVKHTYLVYAGPKTAGALLPYGADKLASYRKSQWIPFAPEIARFLITPTLGFTYDVTVRVARFFGGTKGNYGIAIILLTILVRALMFPLGRKQALSAQKMQNLQPHLKELQEKFKDDKERLTKETFALYKAHGVNPIGGCLPALIQLPIFVGLWQALNTSFPLRHASFLWIHDLAAPDMLFHFPVAIPFLGDWFNLLPFVVVALMLVQTKLFAPPATTPEAEMQQKMMKYMMIFMGVMFYKVPSGLGIYFITSSLWAIGERLLLPKVTHAAAPSARSDREASDQKALGARGSKGSRNGDTSGPRGGKDDDDDNGTRVKAKPPGAFARFWDRVLEEARKDPTYRKVTEDRDDKGADKDRTRDRPRPKPRRR
jgi:YidC/Oxa1 family membrane protein insertase